MNLFENFVYFESTDLKYSKFSFHGLFFYVYKFWNKFFSLYFFLYNFIKDWSFFFFFLLACGHCVRLADWQQRKKKDRIIGKNNSANEIFQAKNNYCTKIALDRWNVGNEDLQLIAMHFLQSR